MYVIVFGFLFLILYKRRKRALGRCSTELLSFSVATAVNRSITSRPLINNEFKEGGPFTVTRFTEAIHLITSNIMNSE